MYINVSFGQSMIVYSSWWFGTCFIFPYIGNVIIQLTHIFQRCRSTTNQITNPIKTTINPNKTTINPNKIVSHVTLLSKTSPIAREAPDLRGYHEVGSQDALQQGERWGDGVLGCSLNCTQQT